VLFLALRESPERPTLGQLLIRDLGRVQSLPPNRLMDRDVLAESVETNNREAQVLISKNMVEQMNAQIGNEFGASLQYVNVAGYFDNAGLPVLAQFFLKQADEERMHAMKFVRYIMDAGGHLAIPAVPAGRHEFKSAEEAVSMALDWEYTVTKQISALLDRASHEKDYVAHDFLEWFAREQLEEVSTMDTLLKMVQRVGESGLIDVENAVAAGRVRRAVGVGDDGD
jgi:bacterioferritin B